jgi:glutamine phosphoribosylpyrophosphate amidotransferase
LPLEILTVSDPFALEERVMLSIIASESCALDIINAEYSEASTPERL